MPINGSTALTAPPAERGAVPGARAALTLLLLINLFNYIDRQVLSATIPKIEQQLLPRPFGSAAQAAIGSGLVVIEDKVLPIGPGGTNKGRLGLLTTAFIVAYMLTAPLFGWLADHMARWHLVGLGVILWSVASGASGLAGTFAEEPWSLTGPGLVIGTFGFLLATRCFVGVGEAAYGPVAPAMLSDLYPIRMRGYIMSWFYVAIPVGSALGFVLGGQMAQHFGWPWAFYAVVPPGLLLGLICFCMPEPPPGASDLGDVPARKATIKDYAILLKTPSYVFACLGMAAMTFAMGGIAAWMPDYVHSYRQAGELGEVSTIFGIIVVVSGLAATVLGGLAGDWLLKYHSGAYFLVSGCAMLIAFPLFLAALWTPFPYAWGLIFLTCFCLFFNTGPTNTILANVTHPSIRTAGFALNILVIHVLGDAISPPIIGWIADTYARDGKADMNAGFLAVSFTILLGGILWLIGSSFLGRDTELAPQRFSV
jgi:MFS family permease